jgi:hypothetical protein
LDCSAASHWQPCGGSGVLDRPTARELPHQEEYPRVAPRWLGRTGEVRAGNAIPATSPQLGAETEEDLNVRQLWLMLPEQDKEEFGAAFSDVVMTLFRVLTKQEEK